MYCNFCGKEMQQDALHCTYCGRRIGVVFAQRKLQRPREGRKIAGVCIGFAEYLELDVTLVRLIWLVLAIFTGIGAIAYPIAWIVMPEAPIQELPSTQQTARWESRP
jgi:phage shock protein C